jgi:hypothetical protein
MLIAQMPYSARQPPGARRILARIQATIAAQNGSSRIECVAARWLSR